MGRILCDADAWATQNLPGQIPTCHTCLTAGQAIGLAFSAQTGCISLISVLGLFGAVWVKYRRNRRRHPTRHQILFRSHLDVYMLNLFISELLMSIGGMLDAKWAHDTQVSCGGFCNVQASFQFLGETSVSLWTLAITLHTGWSIVFAKRLAFRPMLVYGIVAAVWIYVFAFNFGAYGSVSPVNDEDEANYFAPTPFWCWINSKYAGSRYGEYIWLWLAGVGNLFVYVPLFLLLRGNIVLGNNGLRSHRFYWRLSTPSSSSARTPTAVPLAVSTTHSTSKSHEDEDEDEQSVREDAGKMLWYPIAYTVLVLPLSVVRWMTFVNPDYKDVHLPRYTALATATLVFHALYRLSGVVNVGLVIATRPNVLLFGERTRNVEDEGDQERSPERSGTSTGKETHQMRQRPNATQSTDQAGVNSTGFGGPPVLLNRHDDDMSEGR